MIERVFLLHHTHVDFGYTSDRTAVCDDLVGMVDRAIELVAASADRPAAERFHWIHEVSWPVLEYLRRGGRQADELFEQIRQGWVELTALYVNPTELFDRELFEHSIDRALQLAHREKLPLDTAMFSDCPGIPWSLPDILAQRGIRYLSAAPDFIMSMPLEVERPFWWEGPGGGQVLTWFTDWRNSWYAEGLVLGLHQDPMAATQRLTEYCQKLESEGYRWKILAIHVAMDNRWPQPELMDFVHFYNYTQQDIQVQMATNREFFTALETEHHGQFAVHRGAWPDWWANGHGSAAYETACSRQAKSLLHRSREWAQLQGLPLNTALREAAIEDLLLFDEHTWGHARCVRQPWSLLSRLQWRQKQCFALGALEKAQRCEQELIATLPVQDGILLVNPSNLPRSAVVVLPVTSAGRRAPLLTAEGIVHTGQRLLASQTAGAGGDVYCINLPPASQRRLWPRSEPFQTDRKNDDDGRFQIEWDSSSGAITRVYDRELDSELNEPGPWSFAELIHERVRDYDKTAIYGDRAAMYDIILGSANPDAKRPLPVLTRRAAHHGRRRLHRVNGPVFESLLSWGSLPGLHFMREVRRYHTLPRLDILVRLEKEAVVNYESLYMALPLASSGKPEVWIENAGATYRAGVDQLPGSATDWHSVGDYLAVSDGQKTIILVPRDAPLVQVGGLNTGKWQSRLSVENGHLYPWIMNNLWFTNFPAIQPGFVELAWSLTVHDGAFVPAHAEAFAAEVRQGLIAVTQAMD